METININTSLFGENPLKKDFNANRLKATAATAAGCAAVLAGMAMNDRNNAATLTITGICSAVAVVDTYNDYSSVDNIIHSNGHLIGRFIGTVIGTSIVGAIAGIFLNDDSED